MPSKLTVEEMASRYLAGAALEDIALAAGISSQTVRAHLARANVEIRKRGGRPGTSNSYLINRRKS